MWAHGEDSAAAESEGERGFSSEDEADIQCEILEIQRDEANQRLSELEDASNQLLKEIHVLEMQFQIERSCRESAEALAVQVTKENKVLKRASQMMMMMPLIPELPENLAAVTFDPEADPAVNGDEVDNFGEETLLMENQAKIAELQGSVDSLLAEKMQLEQQVEDLTKEQVQLREQLALEVEEKEAILRKMSKQNKTFNKIQRVSQLVTEEFTEMSQKLELEQGLRQYAEVFAHQMLVQGKAAQGESGPPPPPPQGSDIGLQLQQALEQISSISMALCDIQRCYQDQVRRTQSAVDEELQDLRQQLQASEEGKAALEAELSAANVCAAPLQEEVKRLREALSRQEEPEENATPAPPAPPPPPPAPPPPPLPTAAINSLDFLRRRRAERAGKADQNKAAPLLDIKTKAVDEMMERIKRGIVLRPIKKTQEDDSSWKDQMSENRKSAILDLKEMLDNRKRQQLRRAPSRRRLGQNVGEAELLQVLHRRRRAMGENQDQAWDPQPGPQGAPAAGGAPWAGESGAAPVLRRLKQNRDKRDSRIRASALIISQED